MHKLTDAKAKCRFLGAYVFMMEMLELCAKVEIGINVEFKEHKS